MIIITEKQNCCGCHACVQACPKQCIKFDEDEQGFCYPHVIEELCVDCSLCEKVCPCINQSEPRKPLKVYAAINPNKKIRMNSSSGGIFTLLGEAVIDEGGVVFGARFDENWEVVHGYTETKKGLEVFRGSKYVQSRIGNTYKQVQKFLKKGQQVLFSGTPCQIAGLKKFLKKEYDNLLTVDIICHGVPSPAVWRNFLNESAEKENLVDINFRDKNGYSWKKYGMSFIYKDSKCSTLAKDNLFFKGYLQGLYLRPSCYSCPAKSSKSCADITIGDFWGIEYIDKNMDDNIGTSIIIVSSKQGTEFINSLNLTIADMPIGRSLDYNVSYSKSTDKTYQSNSFFNDLYSQNVSTCESISRNLKRYSIIEKIVIVLKTRIRRFL